jgi:hypothetical protein
MQDTLNTLIHEHSHFKLHSFTRPLEGEVAQFRTAYYFERAYGNFLFYGHYTSSFANILFKSRGGIYRVFYPQTLSALKYTENLRAIFSIFGASVVVGGPQGPELHHEHFPIEIFNQDFLDDHLFFLPFERSLKKGREKHFSGWWVIKHMKRTFLITDDSFAFYHNRMVPNTVYHIEQEALDLLQLSIKAHQIDFVLPYLTNTPHQLLPLSTELLLQKFLF